MSAEDYRRKAEDFLTLARQLTDPHDRAKLVSIAAFWKERADEADQRERIALRQQQQQIEHQQQVLPEKEPEAESC
jgi:hypothetical protein